jgi:hypothetical protein
MPLSRLKTVQSGALHGGNVNESIAAAVVGFYKPEAAVFHEENNCACSSHNSLD